MTPPNTKKSTAPSVTAEHQGQPGGSPPITEPAKRFLEDSVRRFEQAIAEDQLLLPPHGSWEVALVLSGDVPLHAADQDFLRLIDRANRQYTGWPTWLVTSQFSDPSHRPRVFEESWEELIVNLGSARSNHIDYIKFDPQGRFFLRRAYQEDVDGEKVRPLTQLDFSMPVMRVAEAIAVGCSMALAMGCDPEKTNLIFCFRWTKLRGRELTSRPNSTSYIAPGKKAYQDEVTSFVNVPLSTPVSAGELFPYVDRVVQRFYRVFDGFVLDGHDVGEFTRYILENAER